MGETKIEWAHYTFNPWRGCTKVSAGCANCYAEKLSARNPGVLGVWGPRGARVPAAESYWRQLPKWDRDAKAAGERRRVFVASLADVAERDETMPESSRPIVWAARERLWNEIERHDGLDFLLLTKRPDHLGELLAAHFPSGIPSNLWAGTSVEDQATADERIPHLVAIPARVRFLSCEPLLGPVDLHLPGAALLQKAKPKGFDGWPEARREEWIQVAARAEYIARFGMPEWVIVGGESGAHARPMHPDWARSLRDQCVAAGVQFLFKQWGEWADYRQVGATAWGRGTGKLGTGVLTKNGNPLFGGASFASQSTPDLSAHLVRVGKHLAGRLLDGRTWDVVPAVAP